MCMENMEEAEDGEIFDSLVEFDPISDEEDSFSIQEEIQDNGEYERMKQRIQELEQRNLELEKIASVQTFDLDYGNPLTEDYEVDDFPSSGKKVSDGVKKRHSDHRPARKKWIRSPSPILSHIRRRSRSPNFHAMHCDRIAGPEKKRRRSTSPNFRRHIPVLPVKQHTCKHRKVEKYLHKSNRLSNGVDRVVPKRKKSKRLLPMVEVAANRLSSESPEPEFEINHRRKLDAALKRGSNGKKPSNVLKNKLQNIMMKEKRAIVEKPVAVEPQDEDDEVLKLRLLALKSKQEVKELIVEDELTKTINGELRREDSTEEQELRLIALKSAVLKKHNARKLRKENEQPYSPTDDITCPPLVPGSFETGAPEPLDGVKIDNDCNMEISPLASPTPTTQCEPIDMELDSGDSNEMPNQSPEPAQFPPDKHDYFLNGAWPLPMPVPLIPVPFSIPMCSTAAPFVPKIRKSSTNDEDIKELADILNVNLEESPENVPIKNDPETPPIELAKEVTISAVAIEEDEEALRTLLLSSVRKKLDVVKSVVDEPNSHNNTMDASIEAENLRCMLLSSMRNKSPPALTRSEATPSPEINLKKVAERIKQTEKAGKGEEKVAQPTDVLRKALEKLKQTKVELPQEIVPVVKEPIPAIAVKNAGILASEHTIPKLINRTVVSASSSANKAPVAKRKIAKVLPRTTDATKKTAALKAAITARAQPTKRPSPVKKPKPAPPKPAPSNNKITNVEKIIKPVPRLVINVGLHSDSDSDYADDANDEESNGTYRDLDNQSPSHIMIGSPAPADKGAVASTTDGGKVSFDMKLDAFLKNVRSKVEQISTLESNRVKTNKPPAVVKGKTAVTSSQRTGPVTPLAVRHLPHSTQLEYKRLVQRMNQLEKQKAKTKPLAPKKPSLPPVTTASILTKTTESVVSTTGLKITINNEETTKPPTSATSPVLKITLNDTGRLVKESGEMQQAVDVTEKSPRFTDTLRKQILLKNALAKTVDSKAKDTTEPTGTALEKFITPLKPVATKMTPKKPVKSIAERINALDAADRHKFLTKYESNYEANSNLFLNDLDKIIGTISEAKIERHKQFQLENEVEDMRAKLKTLEDQLDRQKKCVSKLLPSISESHKAILTSRNKCTQLSAVCVKVGKIVQGPSYQLSNDQSKAIGERLKGLAGEIRQLKSMNRESVKLEETGNLPETPVKREPDGDDDQIEIIEVPVPHIVIPDSPCRPMPIQKSPNTALLDQIDVVQQPTTLSVATKYQSPLEFFQRKGATPHGVINPDSVLCPFQMNGRCEDETCTYQHFS